jgi:hypothetical protein
MDKRTVSGLHNIRADLIIATTYSGVQINNFEQYLLGLTNIVGISSSNVSSSIALIENDIINLSTTSVSYGTTINNLVIETSQLGISINQEDSAFRNYQIVNDLETGSLQNQINSLIALDITGQTTDIQLAVSNANTDYRLGAILIGTTLPSINTSISGLSNSFNQLGVSESVIDQRVATYNLNYGTTFTTLNSLITSLGISCGISFNTLDNDINSIVNYLNEYGVSSGITFNNLSEELYNLGVSLGVSFSDIQGDIQNVYDTLNSSKADESDLTTNRL